MKSSIKSVAEMAGVSTATVSHVINQTRFVAEDTKIKVLDAMKVLNYRPNSAARSLRSQKSNIIGLIIPVLPSDTSSFFFMSVAQGIESRLRENGYNLILSNSHESLEEEEEQIRILNSRLVDGLIIAPTTESHEHLNDILSGDYPVVFIDRKPIGYSSDSVLIDNFKVTYHAVNRLIEKGHRRIAFISGKLGITTSNERFAGYKKALKDNGIAIDKTLIKEGISAYESGYEMVKEVLSKADVSAVFVANNVLTIGAFLYLQQAKIDIPGQVALIGYDDYEWTRITNPPLSVIRQPAFELGKKAAEILLSKIHKKVKSIKEYRIPAEFIERESS